MSFYDFLGVFSGVLAVVSYLPYIKDILAKRVKPERASWLIWSVLASITFFSQLSKGASHSLWFNGLDGIGAIFVLILALRFGVGGLVRRDIIALAVAATGLIAWAFTNNAIYALLIAIGVDAVGTSLTVVKTIEDPSTETYPMWSLVSIAGFLALISVGKWDATLMAYPLYIGLANLAVVAAIFFGHKLKRSVK